jgi:hypothetical protein
MMHVTISRSFVARFDRVVNHVLFYAALAKAVAAAAAGLALPPLQGLAFSPTVIGSQFHPNK